MHRQLASFATRVRHTLIAIAMVPAIAAAQGAGTSPYLVSTAWLAEHMNDPEVVILQLASNRREYMNEHIPGARFLWFGALAPNNPDLATELPTVAQLDSLLESLGVSDKSRIIVYGTTTTPTVARTFMTLDYLGAGERTSLLDGGLAQWKAENRAVTTEVPKVTRGSFTPRVNRDAVVDASFVNANLDKPGVKILDARTPPNYNGQSGGMPRAGHIPSASNVPFSTLLDDKGLLKPTGTIAEMLTSAGAKPGDRIVTYCHIGQQASLLYFAARVAGYKASIYDGSFEDWSGRSELPIVAPAKP